MTPTPTAFCVEAGGRHDVSRNLLFALLNVASSFFFQVVPQNCVGAGAWRCRSSTKPYAPHAGRDASSCTDGNASPPPRYSQCTCPHPSTPAQHVPGPSGRCWRAAQRARADGHRCRWADWWQCGDTWWADDCTSVHCCLVPSQSLRPAPFEPAPRACQQAPTWQTSPSPCPTPLAIRSRPF